MLKASNPKISPLKRIRATPCARGDFAMWPPRVDTGDKDTRKRRNLNAKACRGAFFGFCWYVSVGKLMQVANEFLIYCWLMLAPSLLKTSLYLQFPGMVNH